MELFTRKKTAAEIMAEAVKRKLKEEEKAKKAELRIAEQESVENEKETAWREKLKEEEGKIGYTYGTWMLGTFKAIGHEVMDVRPSTEERTLQPGDILAAILSRDMDDNYIIGKVRYFGMVGRGSRQAIFEAYYFHNFNGGFFQQRIEVPDGKRGVFGLHYPLCIGKATIKNTSIDILIKKIYDDGRADIVGKLVPNK